MTELPTAPQNKYAAPMPGSSKDAHSLVPSRMDGIAIKIVEMRNPIPIAMLSILFMIRTSFLRSLPLSIILRNSQSRRMDMTERATSFVEIWASENINAEGYQPDGDLTQATNYAEQCLAAAKEAG